MSDQPTHLLRADFIALAAALVLTLAFVVGMSGLPGPALAQLVDWLVQHGMVEQPGQVASLLLA